MGFGKTRKLDRDALREYGMKLLGGRALTTAEFRAKLRLKAAEPGDIDGIMEQLKEYGALNDGRYAEHYAERRAGSGQYGSQRVVADLLRKRVASKVVEKAVGAAYAGVDEVAMVEQWLGKKYRGQELGAVLQEPSKLASVYRRLRLAGFSSGVSIRVLKRHAAEAEQLEGLEDES